jgi:hypothetical protein
MTKYQRALRLFALKNNLDANTTLEGILDKFLSKELEDLEKWQDANYELNAQKSKRGPKPRESPEGNAKGPAKTP